MLRDRICRSPIAVLVASALFLGHAAGAGEMTDAVSANDLARVESLLAGGAGVNEPSRHGSPLNLASDLGATEIMSALIAAGGDLEAEGPAGGHPLHQAATKNHSAAVKLLIDHGAQVDSRDSYGFTPLMAALAFPPEGFDAAEVLIAAGANLNAQDKADKFAALHWAAGRGRLDVARFLISKGADVNFRNGTEGTPLHEAVWRRRLEMIGFLVESGADVHAVNRDGETPIDLARGNAEVMNLLQMP